MYKKKPHFYNIFPLLLANMKYFLYLCNKIRIIRS